MAFTDDMDAEDIQLFLDETEELLQILGETFVELEHNSGDPEVIQEIFRVAHTLKGSSGMLGYGLMTELAHAMETLLDEVRHGAILVTEQIVDALLHSLDGLTALRDGLKHPESINVDVTGLVAELQSAQAAAGDGASGGAASSASSSGSSLDVTDDEINAAVKAAGKGASAYYVVVAIKPDSPWIGVRAFQALAAAAERGTVVASAPTADQIEQGSSDTTILIAVATAEAESELVAILTAVEDVISVDCGPWFADAGPAETKPAPKKAAAKKNADASAEMDEQALDAVAEAEAVAAVAVGDAEDTGDASRSGGARRQAATANAASGGSVRIDVDRLDDLITALGELVIDNTRVHQLASSLAQRYKGDDLVEALVEATAKMDKNVDELQDGTMRVRMQPIGTMFNGLPRMVRDLAQKMGKKVDFQISGHETEIDRTVIDKVRDPVIHLLRNSIDHGVEDAGSRKKAGKRDTATVTLDAFHAQGSLVIRVEDDGKGIDSSVIKERAIAKGVVTQEVANKLTEQEALQLIFAPGFSTAEVTTEVSGRGVGMDIVKSNIEQIRGRVEVSTKVGGGTRFDLRLPLTLATIPSQLVTMRGDVYAVPLSYVLETVWLPYDSVEHVMGGEAMRLRGSIVPIVRLSNMLESQTSFQEKDLYVVVVVMDDRMIGIAVDGLMEVGDVVAKPLEGIVSGVSGLSGASVLGDGRVGLILDVPTLIATTNNGRLSVA